MQTTANQNGAGAANPGDGSGASSTEKNTAAFRAAQETVASVRKAGPARVAVLTGGAIEGVFPGRTAAKIDFILVRRDGWSIGGPKTLYEATRELWAGEWLAVISRPATSVEVVIWFPQAA